MIRKIDSSDVKAGLSEIGIVGWVFTPIGLVFLAVAAAMYSFGAGEDPEDPFIFLCVFGGIGLLFLIIGLALLIAEHMRIAGMKRAVDEGQPVLAKIAGVQRYNNARQNGLSPYLVECHYTDSATGVAHVCFSRPLKFNPADLLTADEVPVYIDPMNEKHVYVDIDAVLPEVKTHSI